MLMKELFLADRCTLEAVGDPTLSSVRRTFEEEYDRRYGKKVGAGLYTETDWRRVNWVINQVPDECRSVLDVGAGPGALLNSLSLSDRFDEVVGIDLRKYSKFVEVADRIDLREMDVTSMSFENKQFDCVICMEVIEHLPDEKVDAAIAELRRVTRRRLIMSLPFEEPEPLPHYHLQRFDRERIQRLFPRAEYELVGVEKPTPWIFLTESFRD